MDLDLPGTSTQSGLHSGNDSNDYVPLPNRTDGPAKKKEKKEVKESGATPAKRGRGRPKGTGKKAAGKPKAKSTPGKGRGRPKKTEKKADSAEEEEEENDEEN
ncbi:hypothetical protein J6590_041032 [Homalodisca vitripennis]|nr:hypothetical protein J6590_041032 [Homalodisca vitripennis]